MQLRVVEATPSETDSSDGEAGIGGLAAGCCLDFSRVRALTNCTCHTAMPTALTPRASGMYSSPCACAQLMCFTAARCQQNVYPL